MGQEQKDYTWKLIAKKLSGEASPEELRELEQLLHDNPELYYPVQTLSDLWNPTDPGDRKEAELAFDRHLDRMRELNITPPATTDPDGRDAYPFPRNRGKITHRRLIAGSALAAATLIGILFAVHFSGPIRTAGDQPNGTVKINSEISTHN